MMFLHEMYLIGSLMWSLCLKRVVLLILWVVTITLLLFIVYLFLSENEYI